MPLLRACPSISLWILCSREDDGDRSGATGTLVCEDGRLASATDAEERQVAYTYTDGLLTRVSDILDYDTVFEYDDEEIYHINSTEYRTIRDF